MKKTAILLFFAAFLSISALAQSVQEGINHFYAERYQSAQTNFEKMLASNPNNIEATYWLGQVLIEQNNLKAARSLYEKALMTNGNAPLLMVGMGSVELLEGKTAEARARFENAINASKSRRGNDPDILNAVGRANVVAYSAKNKYGDLDYAIAKLQEAAQRDSKNPDIYLNLGHAYKKKGNKGGDAVLAYRKALEINPSFAVAPYSAAMLYRTQHSSYRNPEAWSNVVDHLNMAIKADPNFAPAYVELYNFYLFGKSDFAAAEKLATQYEASADPSPDNTYLRVQTDIVQKKYASAITTLKDIVAKSNNNPRPVVYRALAVATMGNKDTASACEYIGQFFAKAQDEDLLSSDYIIHAQTCGRGNSAIVMQDLEAALKIDTTLPKQLTLLGEWIDDAKANGDKVFEAQLREKSYNLRKAANEYTHPTELISYMAVNYYLGGDYHKTDSISKEYIKLEPDSIYGYNWRARALVAIDTAEMPQGLFIEPLEKTLAIALTDTVRYETQGVFASTTLSLYYTNKKREYEKALEYALKGLKFDPANATLTKIKDVLGPVVNKMKQSSAPKSTSASKSSSGKAKSGS